LLVSLIELIESRRNYGPKVRCEFWKNYVEKFTPQNEKPSYYTCSCLKLGFELPEQQFKA